MRPSLLPLLLASACVFPATATGVLESHGDQTWIRATNDKARPLRLDPASAPLAYAPGLMVEIEGTWRKGALEPGKWRIVEGPHGLQAWAGRLVRGEQGRLALDVPDNGTWTLEGLEEPEVTEGRFVLVEGAVDGPMRILVMDWAPLDGKP